MEDPKFKDKLDALTKMVEAREFLEKEIHEKVKDALAPVITHYQDIGAIIERISVDIEEVDGELKVTRTTTRLSIDQEIENYFRRLRG